MKKICQECQTEFTTRSSKRKFCCHHCYVQSRIGIKRDIDLHGSNNPNWRGGKRLDKDGYWLVHCPQHPFSTSDGYVREHRLVMERYLGQILSPNIVVHHCNGIRHDNRIENLEIMTKRDHDRHSLIERHANGWKPWEKLRLREGQWAKRHNACIACWETSRPHQGRGLCKRCYQRCSKSLHRLSRGSSK